MEVAAIRLVKNVHPSSSFSNITSFLTIHLQGVQSSSVRQSIMQQILSGQFPSKMGYTVCQMKNYRVFSMGQMYAVDYRDLDRNKSNTFENEIEVDEEILVKILDVVGTMIAMVISGDLKIIDLGRLYVVEAGTGKTVKTNSLTGTQGDENEGFKNIVIKKHKLLRALSNSLHDSEANLSHQPKFSLTKLDLTTTEMFHNCTSSNKLDKDKTKQLMLDLESLVSTFPLTGRTLSSLTDLRLGNSLVNMLSIQGSADLLSQKVLAGVGHCCPSLKVLDLRGSEVDPAIALWLLLEDPFMTLHKYCYSFYKGDNGGTDIKTHPQDCAYCKDPMGDQAMEAKKVTMEDRRFHWSPVSDQVWELLEKNSWHYVHPGDFLSKMEKKFKIDKSLYGVKDHRKDTSEADEDNWETDDEALSSENDESTEDVRESNDCCECCGNIIEDWKVDIGPEDPLYPKMHVLSASALVECLKLSPTSTCNPLATTLEVLFISGHTMENFLSEAMFPFLLLACPNLKIVGDSLAVMKGMKLFSAMEATTNCVTELREVDMVYPSTYDMLEAEPGVEEYMMVGPHSTVVTPKKDSVSALLPYVPTGMISSTKIKGFPSGIGWLNSCNISIIDLFLEKNMLKDISNPLVLGQMVKDDCHLVAKLCPKMTKLKISLDHPWGIVTNQAHFWSGLGPLSLTSLEIINGRWENLSPLLQVVGRTLTNFHIILPKRNDALQGEIDTICQECPLLEHLYLGVGSSPLEVRNLDTFTGFKHLKTVYIGEAFTWKSFVALVTLSPSLEKVQVDKINEQVVGKPPNVRLTKNMVEKLGSLMKENKAGMKVKVLGFSWLDLDKKELVETLQILLRLFPAIKWLGTLALVKREMSMIQGVVSMAREEDIVIDILDREEERQPGAEFEGLPIGPGCSIA